MAFTHLSEKEAYKNLIDNHDAFLFDCDGVIWHGNSLIENVKPVLEHLKSLNKKLIFVTNNATKSRKDLKEKFDKLGLDVGLDEIVGSAYATSLYISRLAGIPKDKKVYVIGEKGLEDELHAEGINTCGGTDPEDNVFLPTMDFRQISSDPSVGAVVCGFDMHLNYKKLAKAHRYLQENKDCKFILTNDDSTFPNSDGFLYPGSGSLSAPLRFMLPNNAPVVVGKPNSPMLDTIMEKHHLDPKRTIMVGDRLDTDILFGKNGGTTTLMVLTGVNKLHDISGPDAKIIPDFVVNSLGDLSAVL